MAEKVLAIGRDSFDHIVNPLSLQLDRWKETHTPVQFPIVVLFGVTGIGKSTVIKDLTSRFPDIYEAIPHYTNRHARRSSDTKISVSDEIMDQIANEGGVVMVSSSGVSYGIRKNEVFVIRDRRRVPLIDLGLGRRKHLPSLPSPVVSIYLCPDSIAAWRQQTQQQERSEYDLNNAESELQKMQHSGFSAYPELDFQIFNRTDMIEDTVEQVHSIVERIKA